jgi:spermidine synthase
MYRALDLAQAMSREARQPAISKRLEAALREPFAVRLWDQARLACRFNASLDTGDAGIVRGAIEAFEPHVPWRRFFLEKRAACYEYLADDRLERAREDLAAYDTLARPRTAEVR